jgi:hypothetical protein
MSINPTQALQEIFNASEQAPLTGPQRDRIRSQAQALGNWIVEQLAAKEKKADEAPKP